MARTSKCGARKHDWLRGCCRKILSSYFIILCFSNLAHLIPRFDTPVFSVRGFVESPRAECRTSVKGVFYQWNTLR
jgi:hypothetical protein